MRKIFLAMFLGLVALAFVGAGAAAALTINFASEQAHDLIIFNGTSKTVSFDPTAPGSHFSIINVTGGTDPDTINLIGALSGTFTVGTITPLPAPPGVFRHTAPVSGSGTFTITDEDSQPFTAALKWSSFSGSGSTGSSSGGLRSLTVNITGKNYSGANTDLIFLKNHPVTEVLAFQFVPGKSLPQLMTNGAINSTSFNGSLVAAPVPGTLGLLTTGLAIIAVLGLRKKS